MNSPEVLAVSRSSKHGISKVVCRSIRAIAGLGIENDAHAGKLDQHRRSFFRDRTRPNLRQIHLIQSELFGELSARGFCVTPGQMGENVTTRGIDLLTLPQDTVLEIGETATIRITGLRTPCRKLDRLQSGLMKAVLDKDNDGVLIQKAGLMAVVLVSGEIRSGDRIKIEFPLQPYKKLGPV
ncbi:MAG TPA: MOSC domain-containing protein [Pyrinomonadaceae bacterium]|nr:MOSC domain-containing protein [Pyrinomonadaceae bacterium]